MALNSKIILCKGIKIDKDYNNVLSYTETQMLNLCNDSSHKIDERSNYSFLRPTNSIYVDFTYSQCLQANYIAFQNTDYSGKWFFAWIDEVIYKSDNNCEIKYTIDAWSTWFNYWTKKPCYILREHVNDDTIGLHTIPEDLHVEDYIEEFEQEDTSLSQYYFVGVLTSHDPENDTSFSAPITIVNKNIMSKKLCLFENVESDTSLGLFLLATNTQNHTNDIDSVFFIPAGLIDRTKLQQHTATHYGQTYTFYTLANDTSIIEINQTITKLTSFTGITPKNNKCFCYPYNYLFVSNNIGNNNIYKYENFSGTNATFKIQATTSVGCSGRLLPLNYKRMLEADDEIIPLGKYPTIAWSSDTFTNWLTEQAVNIPTQIVGSLIPGIGTNKEGNTTVSFNPLNLASQIGNTIGSFYKASMLPHVTHGQNTADINFLAERNTFTFRGMRVKNEELRIIDDYFTRFGYKINRVKEPNIIGRTYWNYLQIGNGEEIGNGTTPANFMQIINNACRKGVTIWHSHENIGNYNLNNTIA